MGAQPCEYDNYYDFNNDVKKLFKQAKKWKNYRGSEQEMVNKRMQKAVRVNNYWETLTAPYTQYGFNAVIANQNKDSSDDSDLEETKSKKRSAQKKESKRQKEVLGNIKKRHLSGESIVSPNKRRKLNNDKTERILRNSKKEKVIYNDDDSKKEIEEALAVQTPRQRPRYSAGKRSQLAATQPFDSQDDDIEILENEKEMSQSLSHASSDLDIYGTVKDSPFTPFADKSKVFHQMMGSTDDLYKNLPHSMSVKKRLNFGDDDSNSNHNRNEARVMMSFRIKWRYNDGFHNEDAQYVDIEATRMDRAVHEFMEKKSNSTVKLMSVKMAGIV